jgi:chromate transport protein ChrA
MLVDQRGWLTSEEFVDVLSVGQALPVPNQFSMKY